MIRKCKIWGLSWWITFPQQIWLCYHVWLECLSVGEGFIWDTIWDMNYRITWPVICVCLYYTAGLKLLIKIPSRDFIAECRCKQKNYTIGEMMKICLHSWGISFLYQCLYSCECLFLASSCCGKGKGNWHQYLSKNMPAVEIMIWFWPHFCSSSLGLEWELRNGVSIQEGLWRNYIS